MFLWWWLTLFLVCSYFWPCDGTLPLLPSSDKTGTVYPLEPFCFAKFKTSVPISSFFISHPVLFTSPCMRASKVGKAGRAAGDMSVTSTQPRTDGAAGSVWQITLLVVGLNPVPTAVSSSTTQTLSRVTVMCAHTCHHTQRERCRYEQNTEHLPPVRLELFISLDFCLTSENIKNLSQDKSV